VFLIGAWRLREVSPRKRSSYSAKAEYPVRRGFAIDHRFLGILDHRWSLSSGAHSRDPVAGDDSKTNYFM
jgi:hypothetical protein